MSIGIFNYLPVGKLAQFVAVHQGQSLCHPPVSSQRQVNHAALSLYPRCLAKAPRRLRSMPPSMPMWTRKHFTLCFILLYLLCQGFVDSYLELPSSPTPPQNIDWYSYHVSSAFQIHVE